MAFLAGVAKGTTGSGGSGTSGAINTTGATLIVIALTNISSVGTVADSQANTWTALTPIVPGSSRALCLFKCHNPSTSASHTFSGGDANASIAVAAFSNTPTSGTPTESAGGSAASATTTVQPGSLTPGSANNILITSCGCDANTSFAINGTFSIAASVAKNTTGSNEGVAIAYLIQTAATAQNPTWTVGSNDVVIASVMAAFVENGGGGGGSNWGQMLGQQLNRIVQG